jgi:hypothetical protein
MSDEIDEKNQAVDTQDSDTDLGVDVSALDEMAMLRKRAKLMGIVHSNNISLETLRKKIEARMNNQPDEPEITSKVEANPLDIAADPIEPNKKPNLRSYLRKRELRLIRLRITNLDPKKKDLPGEIYTVANRYLGTVRKYVPYGEVTDDGYHVPYCIYKMLVRRKFLNIRTRPGRNGQQIIVSSTWAKEFALEELPQLTREEIARLANAQAAAGVFGQD